MSMSTSYHWTCNGCGKRADIAADKPVTPEGWQSILRNAGPEHACSRECARQILLTDVESTLDYWYEAVPA